MGVIWITGLAGVGKTSAANAVVAHLSAEGEACLLLDGDTLRTALLPLASGYDSASRRRFAHAYSNLAFMLSAQGATVVVATVSLFADVHAANRAHSARYLEVLLDCDEDERVRRRVVPRGQPQVGREIDPEWPSAPHLRLDSGTLPPERLARSIVEHWRSARNE